MPSGSSQGATIVDVLVCKRTTVCTTHVGSAAVRDISNICLSICQRHILPAERDQVLPDLIVFRHHLAPRIEWITTTVRNISGRPIDQLIQTLSVIKQHSGRRAPQLRVKGHVFCSKKRLRANEGLSERKVERDFLVLSSVAGVCGVVVLVENFFIFRCSNLTVAVT
ncbi:Uncharacterised protein [Klebsiella pneumoniae]|nr:Uncharacterised protein [Klebsiella pneumoniae]